MKIKLAAVLIFLVPLVCFSAANVRWITDIEMTPKAPKPGDTISFKATFQAFRGDIKNLDVLCEVTGKKSITKKIGALLKDSKRTVVLQWQAEPGNYTVKFTLDPLNITGDLFPGDNIKRLQFSVKQAPLPDFIVSNISLNPAPKSNTFFTIIAKVRNKGAVLSKPNIPVKFTLSNGRTKTVNIVNPLPPANDALARWKLKLPSGNYTVTVHVDPLNTYPELDNNNNQKSHKFQIGQSIMFQVNPNIHNPQAPPVMPKGPQLQHGVLNIHTLSVDLSIVSISTPVRLISGAPFEARVRIKNTGMKINSPFYVWLNIPGKHSLSEEVSWLGANTEGDVLFKVPGGLSGTVELKAMVDSSRVITESNENNNEAKKTITFINGDTTLELDDWYITDSSGNKITKFASFESKYNLKIVLRNPTSSKVSGALESYSIINNTYGHRSWKESTPFSASYSLSPGKSMTFTVPKFGVKDFLVTSGFGANASVYEQEVGLNVKTSSDVTINGAKKKYYLNLPDLTIELGTYNFIRNPNSPWDVKEVNITFRPINKGGPAPKGKRVRVEIDWEEYEKGLFGAKYIKKNEAFVPLIPFTKNWTRVTGIKGPHPSNKKPEVIPICIQFKELWGVPDINLSNNKVCFDLPYPESAPYQDQNLNKLSLKWSKP